MFPVSGSLGLLRTFSALPSRLLPVTLRGAVGSRDRVFWGQPKCIPWTSGVSALVRFLSVRPRVVWEAVHLTLCSRSDRFREYGVVSDPPKSVRRRSP